MSLKWSSTLKLFPDIISAYSYFLQPLNTLRRICKTEQIVPFSLVTDPWQSRSTLQSTAPRAHSTVMWMCAVPAVYFLVCTIESTWTERIARSDWSPGSSNEAQKMPLCVIFDVLPWSTANCEHHKTFVQHIYPTQWHSHHSCARGVPPPPDRCKTFGRLTPSWRIFDRYIKMLL